MGKHVELWGWDGVAPWVPLHVDAAGDPQVDVLTSALPAGAATAANQATMIANLAAIAAGMGHCYGYDGANWQTLMVDGVNKNLKTKLYCDAYPIDCRSMSMNPLPAGAGNKALYTHAQVRLRYDTSWSRALASTWTLADDDTGLDIAPASLWSYNGTGFDRLRTEGAGLYNLRVKLYDGADGIVSDLDDGSIPNNRRALRVAASLYGWTGTALWRVGYEPINVDGIGVTACSLPARAFLYGFNDTTWDRLRSYLGGILKVGRAETGMQRMAMRSADLQVKGSAGYVWWITISDTAALAVELNDGVNDAGVDIWGIELPAGGYIHCVFDPPLPFTVAIWLDVSTATCRVTLGYT